MKTDAVAVVRKPKIDNLLPRMYLTGKESREMSDRNTTDAEKDESQEDVLNLSSWSENEASEEGATSNSSSNTTLFSKNCFAGVDTNVYGSVEGDSNAFRVSKKPIPEDLKDPKYFERRRRNNMAAKKSRDARKLREDQIITRVAYLEQENAILRTQTAMMREELRILQIYQIQKRQSSSMSQVQYPSPPSLLPSPSDSHNTLPLPVSAATLPVNMPFNQFTHYHMQSPLQLLFNNGVLGSAFNSDTLPVPELSIPSLSSKYSKDKKI